MSTKYWRETVIGVLVVIVMVLAIYLAYLKGRGYESRFVQDLIVQNQQLGSMKVTTERLIQQSNNPQTIAAFRQMGYNVTVPTQQSK